MTFIVGLSFIITQESHGVVFRHVIRMKTHEGLFVSSGSLNVWLTFDRVPQRRDGFYVFVERDSESIDLLLVLHHQEWIVGYSSQ